MITSEVDKFGYCLARVKIQNKVYDPISFRIIVTTIAINSIAIG